jgi:hypothetical protein
MNAGQIIRLGLLNANLVKIDQTTSPLITQAEALAWANEGKDKLEKVLRQAKEDYQLVVMQSNDTAFRWVGQTYDPAVLRMTSASTIYSLPPDLLELKYIRPLTTGQESVEFEYLDSSTKYFRELRTLTNKPGNPIYFDFVGERSLLLANAPQSSLDIEIGYIARSAPLQLYTTGTISLLNGIAAVTGTLTAWVVDEVHHNVELIVSPDAAAPKVISQTTGGTWVDPSRFYYRVDSITSDGNLTLSAPWLPLDAPGRGYMLATVPVTPSEHHYSIAKWISHMALMKARSPAAAGFASSFLADLNEIKGDIAQRQTHDVEYVEAYEV